MTAAAGDKRKRVGQERMRNLITDLKYGEIRDGRGTIEFKYRGKRVVITEPRDVLLIDGDREAAKAWIVSKYAFMLAQL